MRAKTVINDLIFKVMQKFDLKDVCFFDCETTGVPAKGLKWDADFEQFPHVVQLAWSLGDKEKSYIIKPDNYEIPPETTAIHGITTERAIAEGVPFAEVVDEFLADANAAPLVCAHNIYFDSSMLKANVLRYCGREYYDAHVEDALHKGKRIDTMMKTIKFVGALYSNGRPGKYPKLEELYSKLFPGETFPAHDALEDIRALRRCVPELVNLGIIELAQKEYPAEQLKAQFEPEKPKGGRNIEFHDPNPVTEPIGTGEPVPEPTPEPERPAVPSNSKTQELLDETEF
jgi:DNA polymerase III epsilon subunit-like protein